MSSKAAALEKSFISNVGDLFRYFDTLTIPKLNRIPDGQGTLPKSKSNTNLLKNNTSATHGACFIFQDQMLPGLNALYHLKNVKQYSIAEIFRERMVKSKDLLTESRISHYMGLITFFLKAIDFVQSEKRKPLSELCQQLLNHFNTYLVDPDSVIVGLIPSEDLLNKLLRDYDFLNSHYHYGSSSSGSSGNSSGSSTNVNKEKDKDKDREKDRDRDKDKDKDKDDHHHHGEDEESIHSFQSTTISTSRISLLTNIINWSALDDVNQIAKSVRRYASILRGVDKLRKGDILIVKFNHYGNKSKKTFSIGGFKNYHSTSTNHMSLDSPSITSSNTSATSGAPHNTHNSISTNQISGGSGSTGISNVGTTGSKTVEEYVERKFLNHKSQFARYTGERDDYNIKVYFTTEETESIVVGIEDIIPLNRYIIDSLREPKLIEKMIQQPTEKFFSSILEESKQQTVNYLISKGVDLDFLHEKSDTLSILDLANIKNMRNVLYSIYSDPEHPFYKDLEKHINERIDLYLSNLDTRLLFMPKYDNTIQDLKCGHYLTISKSKVKQYLGEFDLALDQLRIEKRSLMNGTKKEEVTEWWLKRIETRCNDFLKERGYNFSAVPENYIEQPPNNMKDVFSNLMLIQKILDPNETVIEIITEIKDSKEGLVTPSSPSHETSTQPQPIQSPSSITTTPEFISSSPSASEPIPIKNSPKSTASTSSSPMVNLSSQPNSFSSVESFNNLNETNSVSSLTSASNILNTPSSQKRSNSESPKLVNSNTNISNSTNSSSNNNNNTINNNNNNINNSNNTNDQMKLSINGILTLSNTFMNSPMQLIKGLKDEIYPVINDFILKARIVLCDQFDLPLKEFSNEKILKCLQENRMDMDQNVAIWIEDMCSDLVYLSEMQRLEDSRANEKVLHIVPISGLVMNTFARLENELNTVVELWGDDSESEDENISNGSTSTTGTIKPFTIIKVINNDEEQKSILHCAVQQECIESVEKILESSDQSTINQSDVSGWTPLHAACCSGNADICKLLLAVDDIDVTKRNKDGASVLHYLVRHPLTEKRKEVILSIISKGLDINCGSRHGETPLHSSAFRGHNDVVTFLLENGSNPNAITAGGETSLHYAVTGGKIEVVTTLLKAGAYPNISSKRGTPIELARNYKLHNIVSLLESVSSENDISTYWRKNFKTTQQQQHLRNNNLYSTVNPNTINTQDIKRNVKIEIGGSRTQTQSTTIVDPDFSILIDTQPASDKEEGAICGSQSSENAEENKSKLTKTQIAGIIIGAVGFFIVAVVVTTYFIYKRHKDLAFARKLNTLGK
ncbi:hypothetical protein DLAC_07822 [Tieghemostelium lacteum]|uniref:Uncharacterized protein n=1 Tax=Tieghemostelium lacteum TaxID=361077 RepID=A0A151ZAH6_TIELA|nr:hypothetical protein DLAC_07822 [Tieghemostelium lacteum]|eukprot:KYQ90945.1 hypothetical protein DLAC_07822 [Tieghemostelium lacteum]